MLITWNVNSINSRLEHLTKVIKEYNPTALLLQETKCTDEKFPYEQLEDYGYNIIHFGQKSYNGVAILSKYSLEDLVIGFPSIKEGQEARYLEATITIKENCFRLISVYIPQGKEPGDKKFAQKMLFYEALYERLQELINLKENIIIAGDFNVAPEDIDVYSPDKLMGKAGFHIDERKWFRKLLSLGLIDIFRELNHGVQQFSWWDYRSGGWQHNKGMRIDNILLTPHLADKIQKAGVIIETRGWQRPSDHAPTYIAKISEANKL